MTKEEAERYWDQFYQKDKEAYDYAFNLMKKSEFKNPASIYGWDIDEKVKGKRCLTKEEEFKNEFPCAIITKKKREGEEEFKIKNKKYQVIENTRDDDFIIYDVTNKTPICVDPHYVRVEDIIKKEKIIELYGVKILAKQEDNGDLILRANNRKQLYVGLLSLSKYQTKYKGDSYKNDAKILIEDELAKFFGIEKGVVLSTFNNSSDKLLLFREIIKKEKTKYRYDKVEEILYCYDEEQEMKNKFISEGKMNNLQRYFVVVKIRNKIARIDIDIKNNINPKDIKININSANRIDSPNKPLLKEEKPKVIEANFKQIEKESPLKSSETIPNKNEIKKEENKRKDIKEIIRAKQFKNVDGSYSSGERKDIKEIIKPQLVQPIQEVKEEIKKKETREIQIKELTQVKLKKEDFEEYITPVNNKEEIEDKDDDVDDKIISRPKSKFDTLIYNKKYLNDLLKEKEKLNKKKQEEEKLQKQKENEELNKKKQQDELKKIEEARRKKEEKIRLEQDRKELEERLKLEKEKRELEEKLREEKIKRIEKLRKDEEREKEELEKLEKERKEKKELEEKIKREQEEERINDLKEKKKEEERKLEEEKLKEEIRLKEEEIKKIEERNKQEKKIEEDKMILDEEKKILSEEKDTEEVAKFSSFETNVENNNYVEEKEDNNINVIYDEIDEDEIDEGIQLSDEALARQAEEERKYQTEINRFVDQLVDKDEMTQDDKEDMYIHSPLIHETNKKEEPNSFTFDEKTQEIIVDEIDQNEDGERQVTKLDIKEVSQDDVSDMSKKEVKKILAKQLFKKIYGEKNQTVKDFASRLIKFSDYDEKDSEYGWGLTLFDENKEASVDNVVIAHLDTLKDFNIDKSFISNGHNFYVNKVDDNYLIESDDILTNPFNFYEVKRLANINYAKVQKVLYLYIKCVSIDGLELKEESYRMFVDMIQRSLHKVVINSFLNMEVGKDYIYLSFNSEESDSYKEIYNYAILLNSYRKALKKEKILNAIIVLNSFDLPYTQIYNTTEVIATKDREFNIIRNELSKKAIDMSIKRAIHIGPQIINYLNIDRNILSKSLIGKDEDIEELYECKFVYDIGSK